MMAKKCSVIVLTLCLLLGFASFSAAKENVLKVGVLAPMTGNSATWGRDTKIAVEMAFEEVGYKVGPYKLEVIVVDSQSDPAKAVNAYSEAIERQGLDLGLISHNSSVDLAVMDVCAQYKFHQPFSSGAAVTIREKWHSDSNKFNYWGPIAWAPPSKMMAGYWTAVNDAIAKGVWKPKKKLMVAFGEDTDWGHSAADGLAQGFTENGWELYAKEFVAPTHMDFYPLVSQWKRDGVTLIAGSTMNAPSAAALVKQIQEIGLEAVVILDGLGWAGEWYEMAGEASNGVLDMIPQFVTPAAKAFAKNVEKKYGVKAAPSSTGICYDTSRFFLKILNHTLEKYGKIDKDLVHKVFVEEVNEGKLTYSKKDGAIIMNMYKYTAETAPDPVVGPDYYYFPVIQYEKGVGKVVFPPEWQEKEFETMN